jgi:hypothetical protein
VWIIIKYTFLGWIKRRDQDDLQWKQKALSMVPHRNPCFASPRYLTLIPVLEGWKKSSRGQTQGWEVETEVEWLKEEVQNDTFISQKYSIIYSSIPITIYKHVEVSINWGNIWENIKVYVKGWVFKKEI